MGLSDLLGLKKDSSGKAGAAQKDAAAAAAAAAKEKLAAELAAQHEKLGVEVKKLPNVLRKWLSNASREAATADFRAIAAEIGSTAKDGDYLLLHKVSDLFEAYLAATPADLQDRTVIRTYLDTFPTVWTHRGRGEFAQLDEELITMLGRLNEKFIPKPGAPAPEAP